MILTGSSYLVSAKYFMALLTAAMLHIGSNSKLIISVLVPVLMLHGLHFLYVAICRSYAHLVSHIRMFILSV